MTPKIVEKNVFFSALFVSTLVMMHDEPPRNANVSWRWSITLVSLGGSAGHVRDSCCACQASNICLWSLYVDRSTTLVLSIFDLLSLCF